MEGIYFDTEGVYLDTQKSTFQFKGIQFDTEEPIFFMEGIYFDYEGVFLVTEKSNILPGNFIGPCNNASIQIYGNGHLKKRGAPVSEIVPVRPCWGGHRCAGEHASIYTF